MISPACPPAANKLTSTLTHDSTSATATSPLDWPARSLTMNASRRRKHRTAALMPDLPCFRRVLTGGPAIGRRMAEGMTWLFRGSFRAVSSIALFAASPTSLVLSSAIFALSLACDRLAAAPPPPPLPFAGLLGRLRI